MNSHIQQFLRYLEIEKGVSPHTLRAYRKDLQAFSSHVKSKAEDIGLNDIRGFVAEEINSGTKRPPQAEGSRQ